MTSSDGVGRVLVTGATGTIGSGLLRELDGRGEVIALGRTRPKAPARWVECDLSKDSLPSQMPTNVDALVYLAQSEDFRDFPNKADAIYQINTGGLQRLLSWAQRSGVRRVVYASTGGIYGFADHPFSEDVAIPLGSASGFYPATKLCGELLASAYAELLTVVTLRFFFVYGPEQKETMLIPRLVASVAGGKPIQLDGADGLKINPIHVDDAAKAVVAALALSNSAVINVAGTEILSLRQIGETIASELGVEPSFVVREGSRSSQLVGDIDKMKRLLVVPKVSFRSGVSQLVRRLRG